MSIYNISLRDLNWGFLSQGLNIASGLLLLPVVLTCLSPEELGIWFVFSSLAGLAQLLEVGLQPTISRYIAYIYGGAQRLEKFGISSDNEEKPLNQVLLGQVFFAAKKIYFRITLVVLLLLFGGGSIYLVSLLPSAMTWQNVLSAMTWQNVLSAMTWQNVLFAWMLFSVGFMTNFYYGYYSAFLQGRGDITVTNQFIVVSRLIMIFIGSVLLFAGFGLIGLGFASLLSSVISRILLRLYFWRSGSPETVYLKTASRVSDSHTTSVLWHNSIKLGWVYLGAFLITRMNVLIASSFLGITAAGSYGLTLQILIMFSSLASTLYALKLPGLNAEQIRGRSEFVIANFGQSLAVSWIFYIAAVVTVIVVGNPLLEVIGSHSKLMQTNLLIVFALIMFLEMNHSLCASYLTTYNEVTFVLPAIISGFFIVTASILLVYFFHFETWGLLLSQGIVQLTYNNWKWPKEASKKMGSTFFHVLSVGFFEIYRLIFRSVKS